MRSQLSFLPPKNRLSSANPPPDRDADQHPHAITHAIGNACDKKAAKPVIVDQPRHGTPTMRLTSGSTFSAA